jgi:hypothetical protein
MAHPTKLSRMTTELIRIRNCYLKKEEVWWCTSISPAPQELEIGRI